MQTATRTLDGERYELAYDDFDGTLYRLVRGTSNGPANKQFLHKCRVADSRSLGGAWRDYLASRGTC